MRYFLLILLFLSSYADGAVVFQYHRFGNSKYPSTNIRLEQFAYQLDYLKENRYNVWKLSKIINYIIDKKPIPPKTVALTIDDAYISVFTKAYPMLKAKNYPFTVFVNINPVDNSSKNHMSWEQMRIMQKDGVEFANHSLSHPYLLERDDELLDDAWRERVKNEILQAQKRLQEELDPQTNEKPKLFSYPFGEYNIEIAKMVEDLGFIGVTQLSGPVGLDSNLSAITRFAMSERFATKEGFKTKLDTIPLPIEVVSQNEPVIKENNPPQLRIKLKQPLNGVGCFLSSGEKIDIEWITKTEFKIISKHKLKAPRDRYTCTAPAKDGRWYWYSHLWIVKGTSKNP